ncbi:MAG TPA: deaminase domain-containing protein [Luteibacter sp.]|jgi:hypothetical protein|uniref:deaminase domain-containing protein n=1 Tax=Luteibacter sp. TaxID=1886636 RepID=UPI002F3FE5E2
MKRRYLLAAALSFIVAQPSHAAEWHTRAFATDPKNLVMTPLLDAFRFHAEAASAWYLDELNGDLVSRTKFERFGRAVSSATYGAFEYTYMKDGVRHTRVYYAMSGPDNPFTALGPAGRPMADFIAQDSTRIHAYLRSSDRSSLVATEVEGDQPGGQHQRDAELKALRTIERDMQAGVVTSGGALHAFISQPMCDSCEHVMHQFSAQYNVDINVDYLEGELSEAYRRFRILANRFMDTVLVHIRHPEGPGHPTPPPSAGTCARIYAQ